MGTMTWIRKGECDMCGFCCESIAQISLDFTPTGDPEWMKVRGLPPSGIKWFHIVDPCPQLSEEKLCKIYEDRPKTCVNFPSDPHELVNAPCTYWFEDDETGEKLGGTRSPYPQELPE